METQSFWTALETIFNRALSYSFDKKKICFVSPFLLFACALFAICSGQSEVASEWMHVHTICLPSFIILSLLVVVGIILNRAYYQELHGQSGSFLEATKSALYLLVHWAYFAMLILVVYIFLWTVLGGFELLRSIPILGVILEIMLASLPFFALLGISLLGVIFIFTLFFVTPIMALLSVVRWKMFRAAWTRIKFNPFQNLLFFFFSLIPLALFGSVALFTLNCTNNYDLQTTSSLVNQIKFFTISMPLSFLLAPPILFFFNFALESHLYMQKQIKNDNPTISL